MKRKTLYFIVFIFALACIFTYPLIFKMSSAIPGFENTNEPQASLWYYWWQKYAWRHKLESFGKCPLLAFPFGVNFKEGANFYPFWLFMTKWASVLTNPIFTYNAQVILSFVLSGLFMYYLVFSLTGNPLGSAAAGIIYAFSPYHFARIWQHLGLSQIQWMPLFLFSVFRLIKKQDVKNIIFCSISFLLVAAFDYYYAYFMAVAALLFIVYLIVSLLKKARGISFKPVYSLGIAMLLSLLILSPVLFSIAGKMSSSNAEELVTRGYSRPFNNLFTQSAKPLSYFLPATSHPMFGKITERLIGSPLYGVSYTEHALYLGWVPLILAFVAFRRWRRNKKLIADERDQFYIGFFVWLAVAAWLFSQPPYFTFPYFKIYMPSFFMYKILPMFRAYCRFGVVVMLSVSVLAGFGLKFILEKFKGDGRKIIFTSLVCGLVLFEFLNFPPFKVINLAEYPEVYDWLKRQKEDFVIAEYPLDAESPNEYYKFYQTVHGKRMINATHPGTYANKFSRKIRRLSGPGTAGILSGMGVKYALVHLGAYGEFNNIEMLEEFKKVKTRKLPGLKFVKSFGDVDVYEVTAQPEDIGINE